MKTVPNDQDVYKYIDALENEQRKRDSLELTEIFAKITKESPVMWGPSIIGFGSYHYKYESGREGDMLISGFAPRKNSLVLYIMPGFDHYEDLMQKLGKFTTGKSCLYIKKLDDINIEVLKELIRTSFEYMRKKYCQ